MKIPFVIQENSIYRPAIPIERFERFYPRS
jgi:hypothetical protein